MGSCRTTKDLLALGLKIRFARAGRGFTATGFRNAVDTAILR
jgi:hypothetical protein